MVIQSRFSYWIARRRISPATDIPMATVKCPLKMALKTEAAASLQRFNVFARSALVMLWHDKAGAQLFWKMGMTAEIARPAAIAISP